MTRRSAALLTLVVVLAGCSSQTTTTPTPAVTATAGPTEAPSPSPTPVDVAAVFLPQIVAMTSAKMEVTGTLDVGGEIGAISGSITFIGADTDQTLTIAIGGTPTTTSTIHRAGVGYTKTGNGPWLQDLTAPAAGKDMTSVLKALTSLTDKGVETKNGESLHHLITPAGTTIDPAAFGLTNPGMTNVQVGLDFWAADDGKPVYMTVTISWTQGTAPVKMVMDFRFVQIGGSLQVTSPDHVWSRFTSKRFHYKIAYPDDWDTYVGDKAVDYFDSPTTTFVAANRYSASGLTLNTVAKVTIDYDRTHFKFTNNSNVAYTLAGQKARLLTFHATVSGKKVVIYEVQAIKSGYVYDIFWESPIGHEAADKAQFLEMVSTYAFT